MVRVDYGSQMAYASDSRTRKREAVSPEQYPQKQYPQNRGNWLCHRTTAECTAYSTTFAGLANTGPNPTRVPQCESQLLAEQRCRFHQESSYKHKLQSRPGSETSSTVFYQCITLAAFKINSYRYLYGYRFLSVSLLPPLENKAISYFLSVVRIKRILHIRFTESRAWYL